MSKPLFEKDGLKIFGNNHLVPIIYGYELSDKEKKEFDYYSDPDKILDAIFFRYKGQLYDFGEFMRVDLKNSPIEGCPIKFHGNHSDTFFSGILISLIDGDDENIKVYRYYS